MTPAVRLAQKKQIVHRIHEYVHDPAVASFGLEASEKLGVAAARIFKTLVVNVDNKSLVVGVVPVSAMLHLKSIANALGAKKAAMADQTDVERSTGYVLGGVSPLGQKKALPTVIDSSATNFETIYVSAGRRGMEIELAPDDLRMLVSGVFENITQ